MSGGGATGRPGRDRRPAGGGTGHGSADGGTRQGSTGSGTGHGSADSVGSTGPVGSSGRVARGTRHAPGGLAGPAAHADASRRRAERTVVRGGLACVVIVLAAVIVTVVWPRVAFLMSAARPVVDALYAGDVYVGPGAAPVDTREIAGIVGTRPVATVILSGKDPLGSDASHTCQAVVAQLPGLLVQVVVDGRFEFGCEGRRFPLASGTDRDSWDFQFWLQQEYATSLVDGDVPELVRQLSLAYDAEVKGGRVQEGVRHFSAPPQRTAIAVGLAAGVVVGALALFLLLRLGTRLAFARADRGRGWERRRDDIDGRLGEIALMIVQVRPDEASGRAMARAVGGVADEYRSALDALAAAKEGDDLSELAARVAAMRERLGRVSA